MTQFVDFQAVKKDIGCRDVMEVCGVDMNVFKETKGRLVGPCPIHQGSNREQFVIDNRKHGYDLWHCFGDCESSEQSGGDSLDLAKRLLNLDNRGLRNWLINTFGQRVTSPSSKTRSNRQPTSRAKKGNSEPIDHGRDNSLD